MLFAWWRRQPENGDRPSRDRKYRPRLEQLEMRRVLSEVAAGVIPRSVGGAALVNGLVSASGLAIVQASNVANPATPDAGNAASKADGLPQLVVALPGAAAAILPPELAAVHVNPVPYDAVFPSPAPFQAVENAQTETTVPAIATEPGYAARNKGPGLGNVIVGRTGHDVPSGARPDLVPKGQGKPAPPIGRRKGAGSAGKGNQSPGGVHSPPVQPPVSQTGQPVGAYPTPPVRVTIVTGAAHGSSVPDQDLDGDGPTGSAGVPSSHGSTSSTLAGGHATAVLGGLSDSMQGSLFSVSTSTVADREGPGSAYEAMAGGTPAGITPPASWNRPGSEPSTDRRFGSASASELWHAFESIEAVGQVESASSSGDPRTGAGLKSPGGGTFEVAADSIWVRVSGLLAAPDAGAESTKLGDGPLSETPASSGSGSLETASAVTFGFMLADALAGRSGTEAERPTLLLVESDEGTRDAMTVMLFKEGYQVVAVASGRDAWNVLRTPFGPINMMLLDVHLPDVSGLQLVQRLRENYPTLPVFAWMQAPDSGDAAQLDRLGVYHFARPQSAEPAELVETVRAFLREATRPLE